MLCIATINARYYRNAESAAALVSPLIARALEVLHVQLHLYLLIVAMCDLA